MLNKSCDYCEKLYQKDNSMCPIYEIWEGNVSMEEIAENCTEYKQSKYIKETGDICGDGTPYAEVGRQIFENAKNRNLDDWKPSKEVLV